MFFFSRAHSNEFPERQPDSTRTFGSQSFHLLKNMCYFPLLVLKGISITTRFFVQRAKKQMEETHSPFVGWEGSPAKIDYRKKKRYQLILTSQLEDEALVSSGSARSVATKPGFSWFLEHPDLDLATSPDLAMPVSGGFF